MTRVRMADYEERRWKIGSSYLAMRQDGENSRVGTFQHPEGVARVFVFSGQRAQSTFILFNHHGQQLSRSWPTCWRDRTIARLARELIEDAVEEARPDTSAT